VTSITNKKKIVNKDLQKTYSFSTAREPEWHVFNAPFDVASGISSESLKQRIILTQDKYVMHTYRILQPLHRRKPHLRQKQPCHPLAQQPRLLVQTKEVQPAKTSYFFNESRTISLQKELSVFNKA
jgi:hypothetical protein